MAAGVYPGEGVVGGTDSLGLGTKSGICRPPILGFLTAFDLPSINTALHFCNISEPFPKMETSNVKIVPETLDN